STLLISLGQRGRDGWQNTARWSPQCRKSTKPSMGRRTTTNNRHIKQINEGLSSLGYYGRDGYNMQHSEQRIYYVKSGAWETESEGGGYYYLSTLGVWIEMLVRNGRYPHKKVGARWTIDHWLSYQDTFAFRKTQGTHAEELWRVEIPQLVTTGWRDGSIGGPD